MKKNMINNSNTILCQDYEILHQDMLDFQFSKLFWTKSTNEQATNNLILYFYEPLWTLSKTIAHEIYRKILLNAIFDTPRSCKYIYFVYLYAGMYGGDALSVLEEIKGQYPLVVDLVEEALYKGLFFGYQDHMYIYKVSRSCISKADRKQYQNNKKKQVI